MTLILVKYGTILQNLPKLVLTKMSVFKIKWSFCKMNCKTLETFTIFISRIYIYFNQMSTFFQSIKFRAKQIFINICSVIHFTQINLVNF